MMCYLDILDSGVIYKRWTDGSGPFTWHFCLFFFVSIYIHSRKLRLKSLLYLLLIERSTTTCKRGMAETGKEREDEVCVKIRSEFGDLRWSRGVHRSCLSMAVFFSSQICMRFYFFGKNGLLFEKNGFS